MNDEERDREALFRHAVLGELLSRNLRRGELRPALERLAEESYYFDIAMSGKCGWRLGRKDGHFFTTDQLVEHCMTKFMDRIKAGKFRE